MNQNQEQNNKQNNNKQNQEQNPKRKASLALGVIAAILLAMLAPMAMLTEALSLTTVLILPAIGLIWIDRWAGRKMAALSAVLMLLFTELLLGGPMMWMAFFTAVLPAFVILRAQQQPFFKQMQTGLAAFGAGIVIAVAILYFSVGGNIIDRLLQQLPEALRSVPLEVLEAPMENLGALMGRELTPEGFYQLFEDMIAQRIPLYQQLLPGMIFSGGLLSGVICVWLSNYMRKRRGTVQEGGYRPLGDWALPASTVGGLLLLLGVSCAAYAADMRMGETLFYTAYNLVGTAFCIQAVGSIARRTNQPQIGVQTRRGIAIGVALLWILGGTLYLAIYGCISAVFGSRGALKALRNEKQNKHHSDEE